jgi:hypothetical protein
LGEKTRERISEFDAMCEEAHESMYHFVFGGGASVIVLKLLVRSCWFEIALGWACRRPDDRGASYGDSHRGGPGRDPLKPTDPGTPGRAGLARKPGSTNNMPA